MSREINEIKDAAGAYRKWALDARKKYIDLRLHQDPEIRGLYIRSADRVAKELRRLALKTPSSYLRKRQLEELEAALRTEAERLTGNLTKAMGGYVEQAVDAGGGYSQSVTLDLFKKAGLDTAGLRTMFATVNRQAVEACWARTKKGLFLSDRIWRQGENFRNTMRDIIQEAVATGQDTVKTARMLQQYVRQGKSTLAANYPNMMERMKGRIPGDISYEALRLARTEMTAAFGEGTIAAARVSPSYIGMKWVLSKSHPLTDICDDLAAHDEGLGRGVYSPGDEPPLPAHPNCICTLVPVHEEPEKFVERLKKWRDDPTSDQELEKWYNDYGKGLLGLEPSTKPPLPDISKAQTLDECKHWAEANYSHIKFEFDGADVDTIRPTLHQFDKLAQEWPEVASHLKYIGTRRTFQRGEYAHATIDGTAIGLNPVFYGNPREFLRLLENDVATRWHPRGCHTIESVIAHEFGHAAHIWLRGQLDKSILPVVSADGTGIVGETANNWLMHWNRNRKRAIKGLSRYAAEKEVEAFAEAFAAHYHQMGKKGPFLRSFGALLRELDRKKWLSDYKWLDEVEGEERVLAIQRIKDLKERLGLL